ncbi:hypothetical protein FB451DRAFT_1406343 [Mycena latifolia]|nr:hypothetical protein FB451DRAFT_1406343 [Mycena latifolia]
MGEPGCRADCVAYERADAVRRWEAEVSSQAMEERAFKPKGCSLMHCKKKTPNKHTDRVAWNNHFETALSLKYATFSHPVVILAVEECLDLNWTWDSSDITDCNQHIARLIKEIMRKEGRFISIVVGNLVYGTFEADWNSLDLSQKKEIALDGLYREACGCPRDNSRHICPEMTIDGLVGDGEYNLINLAIIMKHDPTGNGRAKELFLFEHPHVAWEHRHTEGAPDLLKAFLYRALLLRNSFIVAALIGVLESFHNHPARPDTPAREPGRPRSENPRQTKDKAREELKGSGIRVDQSQCEEREALVVNACTSCLTTTDRNNLKRCGRCQLAWYCSVCLAWEFLNTLRDLRPSSPFSECQRIDWKDHKKFCGKTSFDPKDLVPTPEGPAEFIGCPVAVPGFVRTPALWRQIWYLSKADSQGQDYHCTGTPSASRFPTLPAIPRLTFLVAHRRAMASGSLSALYMMLTILECHFFPALTQEQMERQFEKEYRITVSAAGRQAAGPFLCPTQTEFQEEQAYLEQRLPRAQIPPR